MELEEPETGHVHTIDYCNNSEIKLKKTRS